VHPRQRKKSNFRAGFWGAGKIWSLGTVNLVVLACVLRAATKKMVVNFSQEKKCTPRENPGYA